ncbi:MAG: hypothetical protein RIT14_1650 [Pseudomonadota bacterium]|jgi:hypothetical protein
MGAIGQKVLPKLQPGQAFFGRKFDILVNKNDYIVQ